jgi:hypothetical protein
MSNCHHCWETECGVECCVFCGVTAERAKAMKQKDQIRFGPEVGPGRRVAFRRRGENTEIGITADVKDGRPIAQDVELLKISDRDGDGWHDVETIYQHEERTSSGPAQVATLAYREGYDRIFGKRPAVGLA